MPGTKENTLLAALLLAEGNVIADERLTELLWGWEPPRTVSAQLYTYISRLRKRLGPEVDIVRRQHGYLMDRRASRLDITEFEDLAQVGGAALQQGRYAEAAATLRGALGLWKGAPLDNVTPHLAQAHVSRLEEARATVLEQRIEADLELGAHQELTAELTGLVAEFPVRERLRARLMTALYRCGRQADALKVFNEGRQVLSDELGIDPSAMLTDTYQAMLTGDLAMEVTPRPAPEAAPRPAGRESAPITLPPDLPDFTGRCELMARLTDLLHPDLAGTGRSGPHRLLVTGMGGVGKTALALHVARQAEGCFPDGKLYVNVCLPNGEPKDARDVLAVLLRDLGENPDACRGSLEELVRLYRIATSGKRMLIVLDNSVGDAQLELLLPSAPEPTVLITARTRMAVVSEANTVVVGPMDDCDGLALLRAVAGPDRGVEATDEAREIVTLCAGLPLALRIVGIRLANRPSWSAGRLVQRLRNRCSRLEELRLGDLDVRRTLLQSIGRLAPENQAFLRRLADMGRGSHAASEIADALALSVEEAERMSEYLVDGALLEVTGMDHHGWLRYRLNELVQLLAVELDDQIPVDNPVH